MPLTPDDLVRSDPFTIGDLERAAAHRGAGAVVSFAGTVRDADHGRSVTQLRYEAHPTASTTLASILDDIRRLPGVHGAASLHRVGTLAVGDLAFGAAVSATHRGEAFAACAALVERVKVELPVWKLQRFSDGSQEWVNCA